MLKYKLLTSLIGVILMTVPLLVNVSASTGMSNCTEEPESEDCNPQPDRVGNDHDENNEVTRDGPDEQEDANCWGKVTSDFTSQRDGDGRGGQVFGQHASDPVGGDSDNETPREGVGNQDEDHPSDHADTVGPRFGSDEECAEE
ncbi:MAG TPA: hypothetical protein VE566_00460, partial [Nitrososphaeraceae archaeon]|nr:hypothetical protein [Nitrososphaeraceae archaeon]